MSEWTKSLPKTYFEKMQAVLLNERFNYAGAEQYLATEGGYTEFERQLYGRMQYCRSDLIPWIEVAIPLKGKKVLEVGSGSGSATVGFALECEQLRGVDINDRFIRCAEARCEILGLNNVSLVNASPDWLRGADPLKDVADGFQPDIIVCYATLEHLMLHERINLLRSAARMLGPGGCLVTFETPNRLYWFDWHSSKLPFMDWLPDDLASAYYSKSPRPTVPAGAKCAQIQQFDARNREQLYRWGRGVSYHEFEIAFDLQSFDVIADSTTDKAPHRQIVKSPGYVGVLKGILGQQNIHEGFAHPSLDLVLRKRA
jgi:S-adenosylmethionine-dependent methyltransferase